MTAKQVEETLSPLGGATTVKAIIASTVYACPTREWLETTFATAYRADLERVGARKYVRRRNDCVDFSLYAMAMARMSHNLTSDSSSALAFGAVDYLKDYPDSIPLGHRINLVVVMERGFYRVVFFEPQLPGIVELSDDERDSIHAYYL